MDGFPSGQRGQTVNLLQIASVVRIHLHPFNIIAGWSSLEARRAHNPKVIGSNPIPATALLWQCETAHHDAQKPIAPRCAKCPSYHDAQNRPSYHDAQKPIAL